MVVLNDFCGDGERNFSWQRVTGSILRSGKLELPAPLPGGCVLVATVVRIGFQGQIDAR
jgi:hypothetical protein